MVLPAAKKKAGTLAAGDRIGDYEIVRKIGQGGVAEIYLGRQTSLDRDVAIKLLSERSTVDSEIVTRFEQEAKIIARLRHPNIVHVIDRGVEGNRYYFVMDYIEGIDFQQVLARDAYTFEQKIDVTVNLLKALDYAHKNGVIHRDVKPSNILIDSQGHVMVADFGIAQMLDKNTEDRTTSGVIMGTLAYMSPEQKLSSATVDATTDIYAVGVVLYEIVAGRKPLGRFKRPSEINPEISQQLDEIVLKCLEQSPRDRFQTAVELKDSLLSAVNDSGPDTDTIRPVEETTIKSFIGNCSFLDTIKETQFAATYLVENRANGKLYIIKKMVRREMGLKEAKILAKLEHDNILRIYGAGGDSRKNVVVSEYARGGSLAERLVKPYPLREALAVLKEIALGLNFAHKNNIVHGNLRPSNVLFDLNGKIKLTDFSLPEHSYRRRGNWYAAPERKKTPTSDVYSAGVIFHQLLTNSIPIFDNYGRVIWQQNDIKIPQMVVELLRGMLRKNVSDRIGSFEEVLAEADKLEKELRENEELVMAPDRTMILEHDKRKPRRLLTLILLLILLAVVAAYFLGEAGLLSDLFHLTSN